MAIRLYQFCVSHYSEKVRWALDYKGINYQPVNLLPGQHVQTIRKLTGAGSSVPVLDHDGQLIQGSSRILDHLDHAFRGNPLMRKPRDLQQQPGNGGRKWNAWPALPSVPGVTINSFQRPKDR